MATAMEYEATGATAKGKSAAGKPQVFVIRVQTTTGTKRLLFQDAFMTWGDLQLQVMDLLGVDVENQLLSRTPLSSPKYIEAKSTATLASLNLKHGDLLYLKQDAAPAERPREGPQVARTFRPSEKCQHGPRGRCLECLPEEVKADTTEKLPNGLTKLCTHGPGAVCVHCSSYVTDSKQTEVAEWLCSHPPSVFCPKCLPPEDEASKNAKMSCACDKSRGQSCIRCNFEAPVMKVDKVPYREYMRTKKAMCKYSHPASVTCGNCADPVLPSYTGNKNCNKGHQPWPHGVCTSCAPPNANLRVQTYRHCDNIALQSKLILDFYRQWMLSNSQVQAAAILFGTYMDEPDEHKNAGAVRGIVQALYVPPQERQPAGVRFLVDPNEKLLHEVAECLGLEAVGWVVTTQFREGAEYHGKILMSGPEMRIAARFQNKYKDSLGHSRFVTVVIEHGTQVEPAAYQVSDQFVALERDGVLTKASDPYLLAIRKPEKNELIPTIIRENKPLKPGAEILPIECIVKVIASTPKDDLSIFKHNEFPSTGSDVQLKSLLKSHLKQFAREDYVERLSDFNLLCYLARASGMPLVRQICHAIRTKTGLPAPLKAAIDAELVGKGYL